MLSPSGAECGLGGRNPLPAGRAAGPLTSRSLGEVTRPSNGRLRKQLGDGGGTSNRGDGAHTGGGAAMWPSPTAGSGRNEEAALCQDTSPCEVQQEPRTELQQHSHPGKPEEPPPIPDPQLPCSTAVSGGSSIPVPWTMVATWL